MACKKLIRSRSATAAWDLGKGSRQSHQGQRRLSAQARAIGTDFESALGYDEVWCVFDRDDHDHFYGPIQTAKDRRYRLAVSNPCIELWLLIHHRESPGQQHRDRIAKMLTQFDKNYDKHISFGLYRSGLRNAVQIAHRLDVMAHQDGERQFSNPSTSFYKLVISVATRAGSDSYIQGWDWLANHASTQ